MFVNESDGQFQRIVVCNDSINQIEDFELLTVTFGLNCAPYLAIRTLMQLAKDTEESYPLSTHVLKHETYVDYILAGGHTLKSAKSSQIQLIKALNSAGLPLKKITANHNDLLKDISKEDILNSEFLKLYD